VKLMSNPPIKLALVGKLRAGKDTASQYLTLFYDFHPFAFADPLKRYLHEIFPHVPREPKPRRLLQLFGQKLRELDPDVWINLTMRQIDDYLRQHTCDRCEPVLKPRVVVTDCRQQNEYDRLRAEGFVFIRINADDELRIQRALEAGDKFTAEDLAHETELLVDSFDVDYEVYNNGTTPELYTQLDEIMRELGVTASERNHT
jgi:dephospho-CoA kinase